jgi:hypothetical protein
MEKVIEMLIALSIICSTIVLSFFENKIQYRDKRRILFIYTIIISLFFTFRSIGLDLESYREIFSKTNIIVNKYYMINMFKYNVEPFFVLEIFLLKHAGIGFKGFLFINAFIPLMIFNKVIVKKDEHILTTYCLFITINFFNLDVIRHFFAASLYLYALCNYKTIKGIVISALTTLFHYSNIVTLVVWNFLKKKIKKENYIVMIVITVLVSLTLKSIIVFAPFSEIISNIPLLGRTSIVEKFIYYFNYNSTYYNYSGVLHKFLLTAMDYYIPAFALIVILLQKDESIDLTHKILFNSQKLSLLFVIFFSIMGAATFGTRINFVLGIGLFLVLKNYIFSSKNYARRYVFSIYFLLLYNFIIFLYYAGVHDPNSMFYLGF